MKRLIWILAPWIVRLTLLPGMAKQSMPGMQMPLYPPNSSSASMPDNPSQHGAEPDLLTETRDRRPVALEEMLATARSRNPTLRAARAAIAQSAGQAVQAGLLSNPVVGYQGEQIRGGSYGGGEQGGFVEQTIPLGGKLGLRRDAYRAEQRTGELGLVEQQARIEGEVDLRFYGALALQQEVEVRRRLAAVAADAAVTARQLANVGQADAPDILQAEVEQEQAVLDVTGAERRYIAAFRQLAAAAGQPDMPLARLSGDLEGAPPLLDRPALGGKRLDEAAAEERISRNPAVQRADAAVQAAEARLRSARREIAPDLTLRAGEQWNGELVREQPNRAVGAQSFAAASVDLPLWNRNQGNIASAQATLERAQAEASRVRLMLRQAEAPLEQQYRTAATEVDRYRTALLPRAQRAYELYRDRYNEMAAAYPQVLVSQRTLFQLQIAYVRSLGEMWQAASQLRHFTLSGALATGADR